MSKENIVHTNIKGAEVVIYPMRDVRSVHVDIRMHAGSWFEGEKWGAFHFLEHALHLGTKSFPSKVDLEIFKEEYAISSNASCGPGSMSVWAHFPDQSIDAGLKLLCEILFESTLPEDELKRELDVISQEFKDKWSSPGNRFGRACDEQLFGKGHEYTRDGMGNPEDLKNITRENLLDLAQEHIYPANMVISVVGNVDPNQIILKLEQLLPESKDRKSKEKENFQAIRSGNKYLFHKEDVKTVNIDITWFMRGKKDTTLRERLAIGIGSYLVGGSNRSLLHRRLRDELGLVYGAGVSRGFKRIIGTVRAYTSVSAENAQKAIDEIRSVIDGFVNNKINKEDYVRASNYMKMRTLLTYDTSVSIGDSLTTSLFWEKKLLTPEDYNEEAAKVTPEEVVELWKEFVLKENNEFISVMASEDPKLK